MTQTTLSSGETTARTRPVVVVCAANSRYALPLAVMLRSVEANLDPSRSLSIFVVDDGLSADDKKKVLESLASGVTVQWLRPRRFGFASLPLWGRMPIVTYDKLALAHLLPATVEKVIWLDCDVLVVGDLARLWDEDLGGFHALAARDSFVRCLGSRFGVAGFRELGLERDASYFNAGVMVINLARWRLDDVAGQALDYLKRFGRRVSFWDQEGLNAVLAGRWREIDAGWNRNLSVERPSFSRDLPLGKPSLQASRILHFCGNLKPWTYVARDHYHALYYRYLDLTAWKGWRPKQDWRGAALAWYESSPVRRLLYPLEQWHMKLQRWLTGRYASEQETRSHE
jgi:lipopolysaccharide biosynthesis glycosyltransferase